MTRRALFGAIAALLFLLLVGTAAVFFMLKLPPAKEDFAWLREAMKACDQKAAAETNALHVLVVPLAPASKGAQDWKSISRNDIGNAIVLGGEETLEALRQGRLKISTDRYVFSVRDEATGTIYRWDTATGVKWFRSVEAGGIKSLKMQFKPQNAQRDDRWGNLFEHKSGTCYWINALAQD